MPDYLTVADAPALTLNGAFEEETPVGEVPIGWDMVNLSFVPQVVAAGDSCPVDVSAVQDASGTQNTWFRAVAPQRQPGYRSFLQVTASAAGYLELLPILANRQYFQMYSPGSAPQPPYTPAFNQDPYAAAADDLPYTMSFSIEVLGGRGKIETFQRWKTNSALLTPEFYDLNNAGRLITAVGQSPDLIVTNLGIGAWRRLSYAGRFGYGLSGVAARVDAYLIGPVIRVTRQSNDAFVFKISACGVYRGNYTEVPYAGDLSYMTEPRGIMYLGYGKRCPPGFREMVLESRFLKITSKDDAGSLGGSDTHVHNIQVKSVDQGISSAFHDNASRAVTKSNDHSHPVGEGLSVPPARTVSVCQKL